jgi:hypothetical protein
LNTSILLDLSSCRGIFTFGPDSITVPGPCGLTGPNTVVCPLNINILENCKGDYKITLLDDNGCALSTLVLRCSQFSITPIAEAVNDQTALEDLYAVTPAKTHLIQINANNLNLVGDYIHFEEAAYFYRRVSQSYLNLWCGAESKGLICQIFDNVDNVISTINSSVTVNVTNRDVDQTIESGIFTILYDAGTDPASTITVTLNPEVQTQVVYNLVNDLIKSRVIALKQLCECGKVCIDHIPHVQQGPCQAFKGCCGTRY